MSREQGNGPRAKRTAPTGRARGPLDAGGAPSDRHVQVAGEIRRALQSELSRGLNDPRVQGMVSITEVLLTPDFSEARVRVSVLPEDRAPLTLSGLRAAAGFLRRRVMDGTRIGRVPRIEFELDERMKRQAALDSVLRDGTAAGTGEATPAATPGSPEGDPQENSRR